MGYGSYIPFWALLEQQYLCDHINPNETFYMTEFSFGGSPIADNCEAIIIDCIYDELPFD